MANLRNFLDEYINNMPTADFESDVENQTSSAFLPEIRQTYGDIAMSRGQARGIIDRLAQEAVKGNITPEAFQTGLQTLSDVGQSPDYSRRLIRNSLKTPGVRLAIENPGLAKQALETFGPLIAEEGFNPKTGARYFNTAQTLLDQIQKDNLLRSNVTVQETRERIQKPVYGALMDWTRSNLNNRQLQKVIEETPLNTNDSWGPRGLVPIAAGFAPEKFGVKLTPEAAREDARSMQEYKKRKAWEMSPEGQRTMVRQRKETADFQESLKRIQNSVRDR